MNKITRAAQALLGRLCAVALALAPSVAAVGCQSVGGTGGPILALTVTGPDGQVIALARTNGVQTLISAQAAVTAEILSSFGVPIIGHGVEAGQVLWIDQGADVRQTLDVGEPIPAGARVLFPGDGTAAWSGLEFKSAAIEMHKALAN